MGKIKGWKVEFSDKYETVWGLTSNKNGIGSYLELAGSRQDGYSVKVWHGNSMGFPYPGGFVGTRYFSTKYKATRFARSFMRNNNRINRDLWKNNFARLH